MRRAHHLPVCHPGRLLLDFRAVESCDGLAVEICAQQTRSELREQSIFGPDEGLPVHGHELLDSDDATDQIDVRRDADLPPREVHLIHTRTFQTCMRK